jgi:ABC-type sugar transport system permease subunit
VITTIGSGKKIKILPYILILPPLALILTFKIFPVFSTLVEGFRNNGKWSLSGYERVFSDPIFWKSIWITIKINLVMIPVQIILSFCLAMLVNVVIKGIGVFRTIFYLPVTISITVAVTVWKLIYNPNGGVLNSLIGLINIPPQGFLIDKKLALWSIVAICNWKGCGWWMMFILAGLKNIDKEIYESAHMDGANWWTQVTRITIPMIKKILLFVLVANTTANVLLFVPMQLATEGGPEGSTNVLIYEAYKSAFRYADRTRSAVIVTVLLVMIGIICIGQFRLLNEKDESTLKE